MGVTVVPYSTEWPEQFARVAGDLKRALADVRVHSIEHVGSTSVPGLAAKPVIDIDVVVRREDLPAAIAALVAAGYTHRGDLGVADRESMAAPDDDPRRNVYVCVEGTLHLRNHLAMRAILRERQDLRDRYGAVKTELARDPAMDIERYIALKSPVLQEVLALSDLTDAEMRAILTLNTSADHTSRPRFPAAAHETSPPPTTADTVDR
ncbi:GrpB family protein [Microbacterium yannicii]|uniref:GrpB family protein n=1 Tax=Microbacterium yannicii TaxID=671622 RepID=A0ABP9LTR1_9MICO|nr:GrpB family protein [Microbacterium yannicii]MCO5953669.1 GrpB family protein [Microbacterium yannicii]